MRRWISNLLLAIWVAALWGFLGGMVIILSPSVPSWQIKVVAIGSAMVMWLYFWLKEER